MPARQRIRRFDGPAPPAVHDVECCLVLEALLDRQLA
jgi:hypothetical protein